MRLRPGLATAILVGVAAVRPAPAFGDAPLADVIERTADEPYDPNLAYDLALAYHAEHRLPDAIREYRRALQLDPTNPLVHTSLQTALTELGLLEDAKAAFGDAFANDGDDPGLAFNLAAAAERAGLIEEAIYQYRRYVALAPAATDARAVATRIDLLAQAIHHRRVRIAELTTKPRRVRPGDRATVLMTYELRGWGRYNRTGVVETVQLFREGRETHRFVQRSIRQDNQRYQTVIEILIPPDAAPGTYLLTAEARAGSRRDEQVTPFAIEPQPINIPEPTPAQTVAPATLPGPADAKAVAEGSQIFTVTDFGPPLPVDVAGPTETEGPATSEVAGAPAATQPLLGGTGQDEWLIEENLPPPSAPASEPAAGAPQPVPAPDAPPAPADSGPPENAPPARAAVPATQSNGVKNAPDSPPAREPYPPDATVPSTPPSER